MQPYPSQLRDLPRYPLAFLPTPIQRLDRLSASLNGPTLLIKRDDQTGLATGGNKARKLEYLIGSALAEGADCVITAGATQSNHARQTAAAARAAGLEPYLILYAPGGSTPPQLTGNLLLSHILGAHIHWVGTRSVDAYNEAIRWKAEQLTRAGHRPYVIPYGGSSARGIMGYVDAMFELAEQIQTGVATRPDVIAFSTSSGGTQAGMLLGGHLAGLDGIRLLGISVDERAEDLRPTVEALTRQGAELLGVELPDITQLIEIHDNYIGQGYAVVGEPERKAIQLLATTEGILVDPVYTGRALAGLIDLIKKGLLAPVATILFWHTGGDAAIFAFSEVVNPSSAP